MEKRVSGRGVAVMVIKERLRKGGKFGIGKVWEEGMLAAVGVVEGRGRRRGVGIGEGSSGGLRQGLN